MASIARLAARSVKLLIRCKTPVESVASCSAAGALGAASASERNADSVIVLSELIQLAIVASCKKMRQAFSKPAQIYAIHPQLVKVSRALSALSNKKRPNRLMALHENVLTRCLHFAVTSYRTIHHFLRRKGSAACEPNQR